MPTRAPKVVLVVLLVLAGGSWFGDAGSVPRATAVEVAGLSPVAKPAARCRGIDRSDVRGEEPTYTRKKLAKFTNHKRVCRGIWLPKPRRYLVPQGIAASESGRTAWVSGFRFRKGYGQRPCQLVGVDLRTGKSLAFHRAIYGQVGERPRTYCRHGGGMIQRGRWLWLVEKNKLWLVDSSQRTNVVNATRVWRLRSPVRGSSIVAHGDRVGLVPFETRGVARIHWFSFKSLRKRGVLDLAARSDGRRQLGAVARTRIPRLVQGAAVDAAGRLYLSRSTLACGELVTPGGRRVGFIPGAEGIQFTQGGRRLWAVSESGARPYAISRKPFTPAVAGFEWPRLLRGKRPACGFPAY